MRRLPIMSEYNASKLVGWIEINDDVAEDVLINCAVLPLAIKGPNDDQFKVEGFGLVDRSTVDTRLRDHVTGEIRTEADNAE